MPATISFDANEAIRELDRIINQAIPDAIKSTLDQSAQTVIQGAQAVVPVRTGRLRDSIRVLEQGPNYVEVGTDLDYAAHIEFGTSRISARPYIGPQADRMQSELPRIFLEEIRR